MPTPTVDQLDAATIDMVFALRDSLTDSSPDLISFWNNRATSAIATAAAGSDNAGQALTTACHKLQIETITGRAATIAKQATDVIDQDYDAWASHVDKNLVYILMLAYLDRPNRKHTKAKTTAAAVDNDLHPENPKF